MRTTWLTLAAALTLLTACQNEYSGTARDPEGREIRLGTVVGSPSGAPTRSYDLPNLRADQRCYVWADQLNPTGRGEEMLAEPWFDAWELRTGNNQLVPWTNGDVRTYPAENSVNLYAVVGNFTDTDVKGTAMPDIVGLLHTVSDDQRTATAYYQGDLVSAALYDQWPTSETVQLHFYHLLSKLQVQLVPGDDMTADELSQATVSVLDVRRTVVFKPERDADWDDASARAAMLGEPLQADVSQGNISIGTGLSAFEDCVLPPQTIDAGRNFIRVQYSGETVYYRLEQPLTLVSGQSYRFRLIVDKVKKVQTVTPTLTAWDETTAKADVDLGYHHDWQNVSVAAIADQTYDGTALEPELSVTMDERVLVKGTDYSAEYSSNTNAGTAYVTITGMGSFEGSTRVAFTILKATPAITMDDTRMQLIRTATQTRTATAKAATVDIPSSYITYASDNTAVATVNETSGLVTAVGPGTATVTATVSVGDNWNSEAATYTVSVETVSLEAADISPIPAVTYTGSAQEPSFTVAYNGTRLTKGTDYTVAYVDNLNAGTATVTVTGLGRYGGSKTTSFVINKATPVITMSATLMTLNVGSTQSRTATAKAGITQIPSSYITYTSASPSVATVDASTGVVTGVTAGTTTITATVAESQNWTGAEKKFSVEVKDGVALSSATASDIGKVIGANGKIYDNVTEANKYTTARAMIAYISSTGHGLAAALEDASSSTVVWSNAASTVSSWASGKGVTGGTWRLPSIDDWKHMLTGCGGSAYTSELTDGMSYSYGNFRTKMTACGGTDVNTNGYWSSAVYSNRSDRAWFYAFYNSGVYLAVRSYRNYVRAVLAF